MLRTLVVWRGVQGTPYYTTLHFDGSDATQAEFAHAATDQWVQGLANYVRDDMQATIEAEVEVIDPATGQITATFLETSQLRGMGAGGARQPTVVQGLVRLRTGVYTGGREVRGKVFIPGTTDGQDTDGVPSEPYRTGLDTLFGNLLTDATTAGVPLVVYSPTNGVFAPVAAASTWNQWAILRSRRD